MNLIPTIINVKAAPLLEKAVALEIQSLDDKDLKLGFLDELSTDYGPKEKPTHTVVEDLDECGQDIMPSKDQP